MVLKKPVVLCSCHWLPLVRGLQVGHECPATGWGCHGLRQTWELFSQTCVPLVLLSVMPAMAGWTVCSTIGLVRACC